MPTVRLQISPTPAHVRTARLVAAAVARRSGVAEVLLDEVRLAVGEACSRAVELHRRFAPDQLVEVELCDDDRFVVSVRDQVTVDLQAPPGRLLDLLADAGPDPAGTPGPPGRQSSGTGGAAGAAGAGGTGSTRSVSSTGGAGSVDLTTDGSELSIGDFGIGEFGLAVIDGLVDDVEIRPLADGKGTEVSMAWPLSGHIPNQGGP